MSTVTTLPEVFRPMMGKPSVVLPCCPICGRTQPLEQHHVVFRSAGKMFDAQGIEVGKPTITLCGFGNNLRDSSGRYFCHGLAHHRRLHFRWVEEAHAGHWEYLVTDEPCDYLGALEAQGWSRLFTGF